jgi:hypothetical protein
MSKKKRACKSGMAVALHHYHAICLNVVMLERKFRHIYCILSEL